MKRRGAIKMLGAAPLGLVLTHGSAVAQGRGTFTFYNYTHSRLRVYLNYDEQNHLDAGEYQCYQLDLGDHKFEAYLGQAYYGHSFRLTRTTPCKDLTLQDSDF